MNLLGKQSNERGTVLIAGLMLLLVLTLLGIAGMQSSVLQEKMVGNQRDRDLAFQAAEAALRDGESFLNNAALPLFNGSNGLYGVPVAGGAERWQTLAWDGADSRPVSGADLAKVAAQPRYIVESMPYTGPPGGSLEADTPVSDSAMYRVTARGVGGTPFAVVVLQSTFLR